MLKRLDEMGLVRYEPYHGVALTPPGEKVALEVMRHHRLLEAFLADALEMPWDRVHDEAEVLEHYISEDLERRIAEKLGNPALDPHGDPIPTPELDLAADRTTGLAELEQGRAATFARVSDSIPRCSAISPSAASVPGPGCGSPAPSPSGGRCSSRWRGASTSWAASSPRRCGSRSTRPS